jgi:uncharacterized membrane protein YbjE (DUF340 family)
MTFIPFLFLAIGFYTGVRNLPERFLKKVDTVINVTLVVLMITIGANIGMNPLVMSNLGKIGIHCVVIAVNAILCSILCVLILEKTVLPLEKLQKELAFHELSRDSEHHVNENESEDGRSLVFIMPAGILFGVVLGSCFMGEEMSGMLNIALIGSLMILYTGVGIGIGHNKKVFHYVRQLGMKIILLPLAILIGSLTGGALSGIILKITPQISILSAAGMSYYSITGAYMTSTYGIETGTYGFLVNVMREFFTILFMPVLIKISKGSPIAGGAAGNMDTMLMPITKFEGAELGLAALITGTILTLAVPLLLPVLHLIFI